MKFDAGMESWVTLVTSDEEAWKALILAESIRKTWTRRRLTVVTSQKVTLQLKSLLQKHFDLVYRFDPNEFPTDEFTKLWIWNLTCWKKCVYLEPTAFMLKNSDDLFLNDPIKLTDILKDSKLNKLVPFVFKPNEEFFSILVMIVEKFETDELIMQNGLPLTQDQLKILHKDPKNNPAILDLNEIQPWNFEQEIVPGLSHIPDLWISTFTENVLPGLISSFDGKNREILLKSAMAVGLPVYSKTSRKDVYITPPPSPTSDDPPIISNESICKNFNSSKSKDEFENSVAIVGMSCRFPNSNTVDEFWDMLINGVDPISKVPSNRPDLKDYMPDFQAGFLKCPIDEFDAKFFGISPREALFMDPQQRLLLEVIWESLENANINPSNLYGTNAGVYLGIWQLGYDRILPTHNITANDMHHRYVGNVFSATAGRISHILGMFGPNLAIESGCSSSSAGIHLACEALRHGDVNLALATGVNLILNGVSPLTGDGTNSSAVLSKNFRCRTFDEDADGFVRAEGIASVILKRYGDAIEDGDSILGIIRGSSLNNDGPRGSMGTPNADAQERVYREALDVAGIHPCEVGYIEAHGTGTKIGDPTEVNAIGRVYSKGRTEPLIISSVKATMGHSEACSGLAGLFRVLLSFKHKVIPPQLNFSKINPYIKLDDIPARIPLEPLPWVSEKRIAGVSSFGMSGTNVHIIVQEPLPVQIKQGNDSRLQVCTISAKSEAALEALKSKYIEFLRNNLNTSLADISYCLNTGRAQLSHRISLVAKDTTTFLNKLEAKNYFSNRQIMSSPKIVFLFTGQGSQYLKMGKLLYNENHTFKIAIDKCDLLFQKHLNVSLKSVLWETKNELENTIYCQPAIFCIEYAILQLWLSFGIKPSIVTGHSVGEFCACVAAGVLSLENAMLLVTERSKLVNSLENGSMYAVKASASKVTQLIEAFTTDHKEKWIDIAAINSEEEVVISGLVSNADSFSTFIYDRGVKSQQVKARHAFHSRQMDSVKPLFHAIASSVNPAKPTCIYFSATLGTELKEANDFNEDYWTKHLRDTVQFHSTSKAIWSSGGRTYIEVGTQPVLLALTMANVSSSTEGIFCPSLRKTEDDLSSFLTSLCKLFTNGTDIDFSNWYGKRSKIVQLPTYPFQRQSFWYQQEEEIDQSPELHPLLGRLLRSPSADTLFTRLLNLRDLPFLKHHRIAEKVVVPAAAFLDLILQAGFHVLQSASIKLPTAIEDFRMDSPLLLEKPVEIQTIVRAQTQSSPASKDFSFNIQVHKRIENARWVSNAQARFIPSYRSTEVSTGSHQTISSIKERLAFKGEITDLYGELVDVQMFLTGAFQSIAKVWSGKRELLSLVHLPIDETSVNTIVFDAMLQSFIFRKKLCSDGEDSSVTFQLPTSIRRFIWFPGNSLTKELYIHTDWMEDDTNVNVVLYSDQGKILAKMYDIEFVVANPTLFINKLLHETKTLPTFLEEVWRLGKSQTNERIDTKLLKIIPGEDLDRVRLSPEDEERVFGTTYKTIQDTFLLFLARGLQEAGWSFGKEGEFLNVVDWEQFRPSTLKLMDLNVFGKLFEQDGWLTGTEKVGKYKILKTLPSIDECDATIKENFAIVEANEGELDTFYLFAKRCGRLMTRLIQGKISPVQYLFPEDKNEVGAIRFYNETKQYTYMNHVLVAAVTDAIASLSSNENGGVLRILEVGGGSGATANAVINTLIERGIKHEYTFSDISQSFFIDASKKLPKEVTFQVFNIENDPLKQGFAPKEFDVIIAAYVIHATANIQQSLLNLRTVLAPGGLIIVGEQTDRINNMACLSFGFMDGWWRSTDNRKLSPLIDEQSWKKSFESCGYIDYHSETFAYNGFIYAISRKPETEIHPNPETNLIHNECDQRNRWILYGDELKSTELYKSITAKLKEHRRQIHKTLDEVGEDLSSVEGVLFFWCDEIRNDPFLIKQERCFELLDACRQLVQKFKDVEAKPKFIILTKGVYHIGDATAGDPNRATLPGMLRSFCNEQPDFPVHLIDTNQDDENEEIKADEIFSLIWVGGHERTFAVRDGKVYIQRLTFCNERSSALTLPNTDRFTVLNAPTRSFADLQVSPMPKMEVIGSDVEVLIHACSIVFRDIFVILQPDGFLSKDNVTKEIGSDVAGTIVRVGPTVSKWKIGDEVFGFNLGLQCGGFSSHLIMNENCLIRKKSNISFQAASTIPVAYLTSFHCFYDVAKLQRGQRVLIHVATGGVGLSAIEIAKHVGCEIYATAGSRRKRTYLKELGIKYIYHSRKTEYGDQILQDTNGEGVDVVLNSLTGPNFKEASLKAVKDGGIFIEIGKVNIWQEEEVAILRPSVRYTIVDLAYLGTNNIPEFHALVERFSIVYKQVAFKALPYENYQLENIKDAFHHFQEAKHIGKVVVTIPTSKFTSEGKLEHQLHIFNKESTYLITGGLGGIGIEVTKWMTKVGAQNIVLTSRNHPNTQAKRNIDHLNEKGYNIIVIKSDIGNYDEVKLLLDKIEELGLPPLRGIMHAAGVLSDGIIQDQTEEKFKHVYKSKVYGTWNLHHLTRSYDLEFFTLYSSMTCIIGTPGQSNHSAANRFMDAFAHFRIASGLPANTMNFGAWSEIGAAANLRIGVDGAFGTKPISPKQGIAAIEKIFKEHLAQVTIVDNSDWNVVKQMLNVGKLLDEIQTNTIQNEAAYIEQLDSLIGKIKCSKEDELQHNIEAFLEIVTKSTLRIPEHENLDRNQKLSTFGVDSLMAMEIRNRILPLVGERGLTLNSMQEHSTIHALAKHISTIIESD